VFIDFNVVFEKNKITAIVGEIGTGKSTILKMIAGLIKYRGDIYIGPYNLKHINCSSIIYISQHPPLFNNTVYYNLNYGSTYSMTKINNILKKYHMNGFIDKLSNGLLTSVGHGGKKMSGGQRYLIALLHGVILDKSILLLDEPTAALDNYHRELLTSLLKQLKQKTIVIVSHDKELTSVCDNIVKLV
jgi:ABC-type bacteriocin/lantibiotic exporter with double-glycine peptidase domain